MPDTFTRRRSYTVAPSIMRRSMLVTFLLSTSGTILAQTFLQVGQDIDGEAPYDGSGVSVAVGRKKSARGAGVPRGRARLNVSGVALGSRGDWPKDVSSGDWKGELAPMPKAALVAIAAASAVC